MSSPATHPVMNRCSQQMIVTGLQISVTALWAVNVSLFNAAEILDYLTTPHAIKSASQLSPLILNVLLHISASVRAKTIKITVQIKNWCAVRYFLLSNGQQNSPGRMRATKESSLVYCRAVTSSSERTVIP